MNKIFAAATFIGAAFTHTHHHSSQTVKANYPAVGFPINAQVTYTEQQLNLDTLQANSKPNGVTITSLYDYDHARTVDAFGNPAYNTFFRDGKNNMYYQTVPGSDDFCADVAELPEGSDVKHEIMFRFHPNGGAVKYIGLTAPAWDKDVEYYTFQNTNDQYKYYYDQESLLPVWKADSKKLFAMATVGKTFTDKDFYPYICNL